MSDLDELKKLDEEVSIGLQKARKKLIQFKKRMNSPLIISKNGKVVAIPANELVEPTISEVDKVKH